jgi:hypothetical protein
MNTIDTKKYTEKETIKLISEIKCGNKKSEEKFYVYFKQKIELFIKDKYPSNYEIEDNTSEILIKVFENINKYDSDKSKFNTWVINIAKRHMIDKSRKFTPKYTTFSSNFDIEMPDFPTTSDFTTQSTSQFSSMPEPESHYCSPDFDLETNSTLTYVTSNINSQGLALMDMNNIGFNYCEIGTEFNLTSSQVSNKINWIKSKGKKIKKSNTDI